VRAADRAGYEIFRIPGRGRPPLEPIGCGFRLARQACR